MILLIAESALGDNTEGYAGENGKGIDYIWNDSEVFGLVEYKVLNLTHSDHYPVLVTLGIKT